MSTEHSAESDATAAIASLIGPFYGHASPEAIALALIRPAVSALIETGRHDVETANRALVRAVERWAEWDARRVTPPGRTS